MRTVAFAAALIAVSSCPPLDALAGSAAQAVAAPVSTPATEAAHALIAALNSDSAARRAFAEGFTTTALQRESATARAARLDRLARDAGGFELVSLTPNGEQMVEVVAVTRRERRFARFVLFTSRREPGRPMDLFVLRTRDPAAAARDAWPSEPVPVENLPGEIARRLEALEAEDRFSGGVLVARDDQVVFRGAYGLADRRWSVANRSDTQFQIGSISKMFTAAAVMRLAENGRLSLDDTLARWVPEYPDQEAAKRITLRHLLTHRAGIGDWDGRPLGQVTPREAAATMTAPHAFAPDEGFAYSNAGYVLLGAVIEAASGQPFDDAIERLVFRPAGMTRTDNRPVTEPVPNRAAGYLRPEDDPLGFGPRYENSKHLGWGGDASGGAYSTLDDLFAFHRALWSGRLLGAEATAEMLTARTDFPGTPQPSEYGYGVRLTKCGTASVFGHAGGGANSGVDASTYVTLDGRWTVIVLSNDDPPAGEEIAASLCEAVVRN